MEEKELKKTINIYRSKIYQNTSNKEVLKNILNKLDKINIDEDDIKIDELIGRTLYLLAEYNQSIYVYNKLLNIDPTNPKYNLGLYKNYVAIEDVANIRVSYILYKLSLQEKIENYNSTLIDTIIKYIDNDINIDIIKHDKYGFFDLKINNQLYEQYNKLIELINNKKFFEAIALCDVLDSIARENNLKVEFFTLKKLLNICYKIQITRTNYNINENYNDLRNAINDNNISVILIILNNIKNLRIKDKDLVINAIYLLIQNNYLEDAENLINSFDFGKDYKKQIKILKIAINEMNYLNSLDESQLQVYTDAIKSGNYYYHNSDLVNAMDYYTWGLHATNAPIFYYYVGKILYKLNKYKEAFWYFNQYIKLGTTKLDKAYLYLTKISEKYKKENKSINYSKYFQISTKLLGHDYDFWPIYEKGYDSCKSKMQRSLKLSESFFSNNKNQG